MTTRGQFQGANVVPGKTTGTQGAHSTFGTQGTRHVQTLYKDTATGRALTPNQRVGLAPKSTLPVNRAVGGDELGGNSQVAATTTSITAPPTLVVGRFARQASVTAKRV